MKWFHRKPKEPMTINVNHRGMEVTHKIQKMPDPIPVRGWLIFQNEEGQIWQGNPFVINGRAGMRVYMNKSWITGKQSDQQYQVGFELRLEY